MKDWNIFCKKRQELHKLCLTVSKKEKQAVAIETETKIMQPNSSQLVVM